jgi:uncharacterized membrane protein
MIWQIGRGSLGDIIAANTRLNSAPPTYPLLVRFTGEVWGTAEAQLRFVSLSGGVLSVVALAFLSRRWLAWSGTLVAVGSIAFTPSQVSYSRELREYSIATLFAVLVFLTLDRVLAAKTSWPHVAVYTAVVGLGMAFQYGLAIIVASAYAIYLGELCRERSRRGFALYAASAACAVGAALTVFLFSLQHRLQAGALTFSYLEPFYLGEMSLSAIVDHLADNTDGLLRFAFYHTVQLPFTLMLVLGIVVLAVKGRDHRRVLWFTLLPIVITAALSMVRLYPYGGARQDIMLLPMLYIVSAAGWECVFRVLAQARPVRFALMAAMFTWWGMIAWWQIGEYSQPAVRAGGDRSVAAYVAEHLKQGDVVFLYPGAAPTFRYYWEGRGLGPPWTETVLIEGTASPEPSGYLADVERCVLSSARCWVVVSYAQDDEKEAILSYLRERYAEESQLGAPVYLFTSTRA